MQWQVGTRATSVNNNSTANHYNCLAKQKCGIIQTIRRADRWSIIRLKLEINPPRHLCKDRSSSIHASSISFAQNWIIQKAIPKERDENWKLVYEEVKKRDFRQDPNILSSHSIFKIKRDENGGLKLKGRIFVQESRDTDKERVSAHCAAAYMALIWPLLSIWTCLWFTFGGADLKGAYMKSGPINKYFYIRPPRDCYRKRIIVWLLLKAPYGLADAGRQWALKFESWMMCDSKLEWVFDVR